MTVFPEHYSPKRTAVRKQGLIIDNCHKLELHPTVAEIITSGMESANGYGVRLEKGERALFCSELSEGPLEIQDHLLKITY